MGRLSTRWLAASRALKRAASRSSMMPIPAALLCEVFRYGARPQPTALLPTKTYCKASAFSTNTVSQRQAGGVTEALKEEIIAAAKTCAETRISAAAGEWYLNTMNQLTTNNAIAFAYTHAAFAAGHLLAQYGFHPIILPLAVPQAAVQPMAAPPAVAANTNNPQTITTGNTIDNPVIISSDSEPNPPVLASSGSDSDEDDPPAHAVPNENAQPAAPTIPAAAAAIMVDRTAQVMDQDVTPLRRDRNADRRNVIARPARRRRVQANTGTNNSSQTTDTTRGIIGYAMRRLDLPPVNAPAQQPVTIPVQQAHVQAPILPPPPPLGRLVCGICMDNERNMSFQCGHGACADCANMLFNCHICRQDIEVRDIMHQ